MPNLPQMQARTHREHDGDLALALDHDGKVVTHLEADESFVDEDILDPAGGDEARRGRSKIRARARGRLDPQRADDQQRLLCTRSAPSLTPKHHSSDAPMWYRRKHRNHSPTHSGAASSHGCASATSPNTGSRRARHAPHEATAPAEGLSPPHTTLAPRKRAARAPAVTRSNTQMPSARRAASERRCGALDTRNWTVVGDGEVAARCGVDVVSMACCGRWHSALAVEVVGCCLRPITPCCLRLVIESKKRWLFYTVYS